MQRVRIIKQTRDYRVGDTVVMDNNEAFGLIDSGVAILTKDMATGDYKVKANPDDLDKREKNNGQLTQL